MSRTTWLRRLGRLLRGGPYWPTQPQSSSVARLWLQSTLGRHTCLPGCQNKGFPTSENVVEALSQRSDVSAKSSSLPQRFLFQLWHAALETRGLQRAAIPAQDSWECCPTDTKRSEGNPLAHWGPAASRWESRQGVKLCRCWTPVGSTQPRSPAR